MSNELQDSIDDSGVKSAFESYRADPGGDIRMDTEAITSAGRRRQRRHQILSSAAGVVAVAAVVGGIAVAPHLLGQGDERSQVATAPVKDLPGTGRDVNKLFSEAWGRQEGPVKPGGEAAKSSGQFVAGLDKAPDYLDSAWQPGEDNKPRAQWGLMTWVDGNRAAEGMYMTDANPIYVSIYPPPYQTCAGPEAANGGCSVREVKGKGWLKIVRNEPGKPAGFRASLQRVDGKRQGTLVTVIICSEAVTKAGLAAGRAPLGKLPIDEKAVTDALLQLK
jgi:hypothetical protein